MQLLIPQITHPHFLFPYQLYFLLFLDLLFNIEAVDYCVIKQLFCNYIYFKELGRH